MRRISALLALLALAAAPVLAQTPSDLEPLPEPPPPPVMSQEDAALEPEVTIKKREGETVEEYRINGRLYKVVVTPEHGVPYTLIDPRGDGFFVPMEGPGVDRISVPMWVIGTF